MNEFLRLKILLVYRYSYFTSKDVKFTVMFYPNDDEDVNSTIEEELEEAKEELKEAKEELEEAKE